MLSKEYFCLTRNCIHHKSKLSKYSLINRGHLKSMTSTTDVTKLYHRCSLNFVIYTTYTTSMGWLIIKNILQAKFWNNVEFTFWQKTIVFLSLNLYCCRNRTSRGSHKRSNTGARMCPRETGPQKECVPGCGQVYGWQYHSV